MKKIEHFPAGDSAPRERKTYLAERPEFGIRNSEFLLAACFGKYSICVPSRREHVSPSRDLAFDETAFRGYGYYDRKYDLLRLHPVAPFPALFYLAPCFAPLWSEMRFGGVKSRICGVQFCLALISEPVRAGVFDAVQSESAWFTLIK
jgi:hypothetical protein